MGSLPLERSINHYTNFHQILLVGEGDFSFSLALATAFGSAENMVPTSLDSEGTVIQLYKSAHETLSKLKKLGAMILHGVNARTMEKHHIIRKIRFHRIVFNFPHAGCYGCRESDEKVIKKHRKLSKLFFLNARTMLSEIGEIHVSHKEGDPYKKWELVKQAEECGLLLKESVHFTKEDYPGYTNRKGAGSNAGQTFCLGDCRTYKFVLGPELLYKQKLMAIQVVLSNVSSKDSAENFETGILKPGSKRQPKGKMIKADSETLFNGLEMLLNEEINTSDEFARQMTGTLRQMAQAWSVKTEIAKKLNEAFAAIERFETSLADSILELESERQARKVAERAKVDLEKSLNQLRVILDKELNKNDELKKQRDGAFLQREEACRVKSKIVESNLELESARQARRVAETEKADLTASLNHLKVILSKERQKNNELEKQRDAAFLQNEKNCIEKTSIADQLDEVLAKDAARKRDNAGVTCCGFLFVLRVLFIVLCLFVFSILFIVLCLFVFATVQGVILLINGEKPPHYVFTKY